MTKGAWVRIYYEDRGRHEKVVTWMRNMDECKQFIKDKGAVFIKAVKYDGQSRTD